MAKMPVTRGAVDLRADHEPAAIDLGLDRVGERFREARPPCSAVELRGGVEQWPPAAGAGVRARRVRMMEGTAERALGRPFSQHAIRRRRQDRAPLLVGLRDRECVRRLAMAGRTGPGDDGPESRGEGQDGEPLAPTDAGRIEPRFASALCRVVHRTPPASHVAPRAYYLSVGPCARSHCRAAR